MIHQASSIRSIAPMQPSVAKDAIWGAARRTPLGADHRQVRGVPAGAASHARSTAHAFTTVAALNPPRVPQPPGAAHAQRDAVWREIERTAYKTLPDAHHTLEDPFALFANTNAHRLNTRIDHRWQQIFSLPLWLGLAGAIRGAQGGRAAMEKLGTLVAKGDHRLGDAGEAAGSVLGSLLLGAAGTLGLPWVAAAYAAYDAPSLAKQLLTPPRALVAKVEWKPCAQGPYGGLFKGGAPALFSIIEGRFGPMLRLQVFVDGQEPITLSTREALGKDITARLAHVLPNGMGTPGPVPDNLYVQLWDIFGDPRNLDWRQAAMAGVKPGEELAYLHDGHMGGGVDDGLGHIVAETPLVASQFGDDHI